MRDVGNIELLLVTKAQNKIVYFYSKQVRKEILDMEERIVTISTHNGSKSCREHNIRNPKVVSKEHHIDPNGVFEIWHDEKPRDAYQRIFGEAIAEYNSKQTRRDRRKEDYYDEICKDKKKHPVYEMIIGVYGKKPDGTPVATRVERRNIMKQFVDE